MARKKHKNRINTGIAYDTLLKLYHKNDKSIIIVDPKM